MRVLTESGSAYDIDLDNKTVTRIQGVLSNNLRRDEEALEFVQLESVEIGKPLLMLLRLRDDEILTVRQTTPVVEIVE